jgi:putative nucleotidyltransferase with HDIG domain
VTVRDTAKSEHLVADREEVRRAFPELELIDDAELAEIVIQVWLEVWGESEWQRLEDAPKNPETVTLQHSVVAHTRSVTKQALAIADAVQEFHGLETDRDLIVASCLLHDVSKLLEFEPGDGDGPRTARFGELIQHGVYGMHMAFAHRLPVELAHIIGSHTTQSRLPPKTLEAVIVHYADFADSDALVWSSGGKLLLTASR